MASSSLADGSCETNDSPEAEWITHVEEEDHSSTDDMAEKLNPDETDPTILEVLKRKVYLTGTGDSECSDPKKAKEDNATNLDLEFVEVDPEESEWMMGDNANARDFDSAKEKEWKANDSPETKKEKHFLSLISVIASKNAMEAAEEGSTVAKSVSDSLSKNQWQVHMKPKYFKSVNEEDLITWSGEGSPREIISHKSLASQNKKNSRKKQQMFSKWMLNPCRTMCAFVETSIVKGEVKNTYYCNFCKLTESTYGGIYQHLNHHMFVCGSCAYHSSSRLDVEIHREYADHVTPLAQGYLAHRQRETLIGKCTRTPEPSSSLLDWQTIREDTEALIIIGSPFFPESAQDAYNRAHPGEEENWDEINGPVNIVCALPYHRYVSQKSCRKNVLEYHCNFCQSTPIYTQELYRHLDFHSFSCSVADCEYQCFTNLELFLHRRKCHQDVFKDFLEKLVILKPEISTKEEAFIQMGIGEKWTVILKLPRETVPQSSSIPSKGIVHKKEREWRCKVCNNFVINKGGLTTHVVLLHNVKPKEAHLYMEPML